MEAERLIEELCLRFGICREFGDRLKPLVEIAVAASKEKRERLLGVVERSFAEEARRRSATLSPSDLPPQEWSLLKAIASVLHGWEPPLWLRLWEESHRRAQSG